MNFAKIILYLLFLGIPQLSSAQELHYDQYTTDDGLPSNTIYEIVQDSTGLLWMGTENGLVSYDGVSFERFSDPRLKDNDIIELEISKDGHVTFCNISNQYCRLEGENVKFFEIDFDIYIDLRSTPSKDYIYEVNGLSINDVSEIYEVSDSCVLPLHSLHFVAIDFDSLNGIILYDVIGNRNTDCEIDIEIIKIDSFEYLGGAVCKAIVRGEYYIVRSKEIWLVDSLLFHSEDFSSFTSMMKLNDKIYLTSSKGLTIYNQATGLTRDFLKSYELNFIFKDAEGTLWVSTVNDGLLKIFIEDFRILPKVENGEEIRDLIIVNSHIIALSYSNIVMYNKHLEIEKNIALNRSSDKSIIAVDNKVYLYEKKGGKQIELEGSGIDTQSFNNPIKFGFQAISLINDEIYFASRKYLFSATKSNFNLDEVKSLSRVSKANVIIESGDQNSIYIGTDNGLFSYNINDGILTQSENIFRNRGIKSLLLDEEEMLWVGTSNDGAYSIDDNGKIDSINLMDCIGSSTINDVIRYGEYLFLATPSGVVKYNLNNKKCFVLNEYAGLLTNNIRKIDVLSLDSIFITQGKDIIMVNNSMFDSDVTSPKLILKSFFVNNRARVLNNKTSIFEYTENNIDVQFDFYTFRNPGNKKLKYRFYKRFVMDNF